MKGICLLRENSFKISCKERFHILIWCPLPDYLLCHQLLECELCEDSSTADPGRVLDTLELLD